MSFFDKKQPHTKQGWLLLSQVWKEIIYNSLIDTQMIKKQHLYFKLYVIVMHKKYESKKKYREQHISNRLQKSKQQSMILNTIRTTKQSMKSFALHNLRCKKLENYIKSNNLIWLQLNKLEQKINAMSIFFDEFNEMYKSTRI